MIKHDCVSRRWLIKAFRNYFKGLNHTVTEEDIEAYLVAAPSIDISGKWEMIGSLGLAYKCSKCRTIWSINSNFCPNCGANMKK